MKYDTKNMMTWMHEDIYLDKKVKFRKNGGEWKDGTITNFSSQADEGNIQILTNEYKKMYNEFDEFVDTYRLEETTGIFYSDEIGYDSENKIYKIDRKNEKYDIYEIKVD